MTKKRNPQDSTRRNVQATNKRLRALEAGLRQTKDVIGLMARWIAETNPETFDKPLSRQNAAEIIEKLK